MDHSSGVEITLIHKVNALSFYFYNYHYNSISATTDFQLFRTDDAATATYNGGFEFKDAVKQADEYAYDKNGNMKI